MYRLLRLINEYPGEEDERVGHSNAFHPQYDELEVRILEETDRIMAIEAIMDTYGDEIKRLIYTYMKNTADTEDITQEVFVSIYHKLHTFKGNSTLRSWIYSVAINKCKDHLRSWHGRNQRLREKLLQTRRVSNSISKTPEDELIQQNEASELIKLVMELPLKYREVIVLYYFKDLSIKEIVKILQVKDATVKTRLSRGRNKLRSLLSSERGESNG